MRRGPALMLLAATISASLDAARMAGAQEADDPADVVAPAPPGSRIFDGQFDSWFFGARGNAASTRRIVEAWLKSRIGSVDQACGLSRSQREKLELAGRGDIKRFYDRVEDMREQVQRARADVGQFREFMLDVQAQGRNSRFLLFDEGSLFYKTLARTLTPEQAARYRGHWDSRRLHRLQSRVEWVVQTVEKDLNLSDAESLGLLAVLLEETRPPLHFGPSDYYGIMYQASRIPEAKLRPIFVDASHWRDLRAEFDEARRKEPMLRSAGYLPEDRPARDSARGDPTRGGGDLPGPASAARGRGDAADRPTATREKRAS